MKGRSIANEANQSQRLVNSSRWQSIIATWLRPYNIVIVTVALSFLAWKIPDIGGLRRGFQTYEDPSLLSIVVLLLWYGCIYLTAFVGFTIGKSIVRRPTIRLAPADSLTYRVLVISSVLGTLAAFLVIYRAGALSQYMSNASETSANVLKEALYEDYSIGVVSLRYVSVIASSFALFRFLRGYSIRIWDIVSLICLLAASFITGRILITWTVCLTAGLVTSPFVTKRSPRSGKSVLILVISVLSIVWALNYSRNALYYRAEGHGNFISAGLGEAMTYLGSPMQVSIGVANQWEQGSWRSLANNVDHESNLTTNSALAELVPELGGWAFALISVQSFGFALLAGWASRQKSIYFYATYPIISYGFAEIWRLDLLRVGIFFCLIAIALSIPLVVDFGPQLIRPKKPRIKIVSPALIAEKILYDVQRPRR